MPAALAADAGRPVTVATLVDRVWDEAPPAGSRPALGSYSRGRRILIMLDNPASSEQVRPLLPGTASRVILVTSRDLPRGLVCLHVAHRLDLDRLPGPDAGALLHRLPGARVDAVPETALASRCARLPLALRVTAGLAARAYPLPRRARPGSGIASSTAATSTRLSWPGCAWSTRSVR